MVVNILSTAVLCFALLLFAVGIYLIMSAWKESHPDMDDWYDNQMDIIAIEINCGNYENAVAIIDFMCNLDKISEDESLHQARIVVLNLLRNEVINLATKFDEDEAEHILHVMGDFDSEDEDVMI